MAGKVRHLVAHKIYEAVSRIGSSKPDVNKLACCIRIDRLSKGQSSEQQYALAKIKKSHLPLCGLQDSSLSSQIKEKVLTDARLLKANESDKNLVFYIHPDLIKEWTFEDLIQRGKHYGMNSELFRYQHRKTKCKSESDILQETSRKSQNIVVEYGSPNIAKPFHIGHLRSLVIGNCLANLHKELGHSVHRINYLGDWGTQFGLLGTGFQKFGSKEKLESETGLRHLFEIYVEVNKAAETDSSIKDEALKFFRQMEQGNEQALSLWQKCKDLSLKEFNNMFKRIGIEFDVTVGESDYHDAANKFIEMLKSTQRLQFNEESVGCIDVGSEGNPELISVLKSDGSTLYLTRDIVALLYRQQKYKFDQMYYVVENSQALHFTHLISVVRKLGHEWADRPVTDFHVKFGRVRGMSTRKGQVVFLRDILNEAKTKMLDHMKQTKTTKPDIDMDMVADRLGISALFVQNLKEPRQKDYTFNWSTALKFQGDTGVFLQYTHARLCSLERNCGMELDLNCDLSTLCEPEALELVIHMLKWDQALYEAYVQLEPYHIVQYLFTLVKLCNVCVNSLRVRDQESKIAQPRLLMFHLTRQLLGQGLEIIGLQPLEKL